MCIPVILPEAAIGLAAAHILGVGLIAGIVVFNSNGMRKGMSSLFGIDRSRDSPLGSAIGLESE